MAVLVARAWWLWLVAVVAAVAVAAAATAEDHTLARDMFKLTNDNTTLDASGLNITQVGPNDFDGLYDLAAFRNLLINNESILILEFKNNLITNLPIFSTHPSLYSLRDIVFSQNLISKLDRPETFVGLTQLNVFDVSDNLIEHLHEDIFRPLLNILNLDFHNNKIRYLPQLLFSENEILSWLDFKNNLLEYLPMGIFRRNIFLRGVDLSFNRLVYLPDKFLPDKLPPEYRQFTTTIYLQRNLWQCACLNDILIKIKKSRWRVLGFDRNKPACLMYGLKNFRCIRNYGYSELAGLQTTP